MSAAKGPFIVSYIISKSLVNTFVRSETLISVAYANIRHKKIIWKHGFYMDGAGYQLTFHMKLSSPYPLPR